MAVPSEKLSGVVESVRQDARIRTIVLRLDGTVPGIAMAGTYGAGKSVNAGIMVFFYGDNAGETLAASEPRWREWLSGPFAVGA